MTAYHELASPINLRPGTNRRYLLEVEGDVGEAGCGPLAIESRKTVETAIAPTSFNLEGFWRRIEAQRKRSKKPPHLSAAI